MKIRALGSVPRITITPSALNKMKHYAKLSKNEIGWLGDVEVDDNALSIKDVFLLKQEVNAATCELCSDAILNLYEQRMENDIPTDTIILWGHSHVHMGVSPSSQDDVQFRELGKNSHYFIRIIVNKSYDIHLSLIDNRRGIIYEDMSWQLELETDDLTEEITAEITKNVTIKKYKYGYVSTLGGFKNSDDEGDDDVDGYI